MTARSLGQYYRIDGDTLERVYKEHLSGYYSWKDRPHADKYLLFPENFGPKMSIDETSTKDGELFTILSNKEGHCKKGSIAAIIRGTRAEEVVDALQKVPELVRKQVGEVTLDFSSSMAAIVETVFPWAYRTLDRFHMQSMAIDAIRNLRMKHKREAMAEEAAARKRYRQDQIKKREHMKKKYKIYREGHPLPQIKAYIPERVENGDTIPELLERSAYLLTMSSEKWTENQKIRAQILFRRFPDIKNAYSLSHSLRVIFNNRNATKESARSSLSQWYEKAEKSRNEDFRVLSQTLQSREDDVLNYFLFRSTNASAEALNTKIKAFRAQLRGIIDLKFFLFRLTRIYA